MNSDRSDDPIHFPAPSSDSDINNLRSEGPIRSGNSSPLRYPSSSEGNFGSLPASSLTSRINSAAIHTPPATDLVQLQWPQSSSSQNIPPSSSLGDVLPATPRHLRRVRNDLGGESHLSQFYSNADLSSEAGANNLDKDINNGHPSSAIGSASDTNGSSDKVRVIWGTTIVMKESAIAFKSFLREFTCSHRKAYQGNDRNLTDIDFQPYYPRLLEQMRDAEATTMNLDCLNLKAFRPAAFLYDEIINYPQDIIPMLDQLLSEFYFELFPDMKSITEFLQVRPFNIDRSVNMRELDPCDIDRLISVKGLVIRSSNIIPDMRTAFFKCNKCHYSLYVDNVKGKITEPLRCPRQECNQMHSMALIHNRCIFNDRQSVRLQETPDTVPDGQTPHTVSLYMYDALVDVVRPGDRVEITGIYRAVSVRLNPRQRRINSLFRTYVDVIHVKKIESSRFKATSPENMDEFLTHFEEGDEIKAFAQAREDEIIKLSKLPNLYESLTRSLAPSIWEMEDVKKGLLLQLFGGVPKSISKYGNCKFRGDINILLAGDPGVSKSQLLQYVHKLAPRGIYTSGKGSSAVGLTAYVTKDPDTKQYVLESGALVLSDGGLCCIDEFDKMNDATRAILHEVMEQQTISIAKAGIITSLNARTSILASANPIESKFNPKKSIVENINLPPTLLSRFDIIYLVLDKPNAANDNRLAEHIIDLFSGHPKTNDAIIDIKLLSDYIAYARANIKPVLGDSAIETLIDGYVSMRRINGASSGKTVSATTRQLESLIRLSEAHAKMRLSHEVQQEDALEAIRLMKEAILSYAIDPVTGRIDMDLVNTGKSSALRDLQNDLKKATVALLNSLTRTENGSIDFNTLFSELSNQSSVSVNEKWLRNVLEELMEEECIHVTGNLYRSGAGGNVSIRKIV